MSHYFSIPIVNSRPWTESNSDWMSAFNESSSRGEVTSGLARLVVYQKVGSRVSMTCGRWVQQLSPSCPQLFLGHRRDLVRAGIVLHDPVQVNQA